ncbi:MAG: hypothetical protein QXF55_03195 [Candidatus Aenigmatarchaeota archaeon]
MRAAKKGQFELSMLIIEVAIVVIGLFVIWQLINTLWQPHRQIAFANAELLRMAIDDVCAGGTGTTKTISFDFPQPAIATIGLTNVISKVQMRTKTDPDYLIYYEAFPPGEGAAWEAFLELPRLAVAALTKRSVSDLDREAANLFAQLSSAQNVSAVALSNVMLSNDSLTGSIGHWEGDFYKFDNYTARSVVEKSLVKYRACGAYSLCFKTKEGIYRLPLPSCENKKISLMALTNVRATYTDRSDFYIASPCKGKAIITFGTCVCEDTSRAGTSNAYAFRGSPLIRRDGASASEIKQRVTCWNRFGNSPDEDATATVDKCVSVEVDDETGFCSTSNYERFGFGFGFGNGLIEVVASIFSTSTAKAVVLSEASQYLPSFWESGVVWGFWPEHS